MIWDPPGLATLFHGAGFAWRRLGKWGGGGGGRVRWFVRENGAAALEAFRSRGGGECGVVGAAVVCEVCVAAGRDGVGGGGDDQGIAGGAAGADEGVGGGGGGVLCGEGSGVLGEAVCGRRGKGGVGEVAGAGDYEPVYDGVAVFEMAEMKGAVEAAGGGDAGGDGDG